LGIDVLNYFKIGNERIVLNKWKLQKLFAKEQIKHKKKINNLKNKMRRKSSKKVSRSSETQGKNAKINKSETKK
jgi:hypothetical protein